MYRLADISALDGGRIPLALFNLQPGTIVKLLFEIPGEASESMWVHIEQADTGAYQGSLRNTATSGSPAWGDRVTFEARHIVRVYDEAQAQTEVAVHQRWLAERQATLR